MYAHLLAGCDNINTLPTLSTNDESIRIIIHLNQNIMNRHYRLFIILVLLIPVFSCSDDEVPTVNESDFFIQGVVENQLLKYPQVDFEWTNVSNKYFTEFRETWLQAYIDSTDLSAGYWKIRVHDLNIEDIELPYLLGNSEGSVTWFDPSVDEIIANNPNCQGVDSGCTFALSSDRNEIVITSVENGIIEGEFSGNASIVGTGFALYSDSLLYHTITNGRFRIKYRKE